MLSLDLNREACNHRHFSKVNWGGTAAAVESILLQYDVSEQFAVGAGHHLDEEPALAHSCRGFNSQKGAFWRLCGSREGRVDPPCKALLHKPCGGVK